MTLPSRDHVTDAVIAMLAKATGKDIGDAQAPNPSTGEVTYPYAVVEPITGGTSDGDVAQPDGMPTLIYQVTSVGETRKQAEAMAGRVHRAVLGRNPAGGFLNPITPTPPTVVIHRALDSTGGVDREGPLFNATDRYALTVHTT